MVAPRYMQVSEFFCWMSVCLSDCLTIYDCALLWTKKIIFVYLICILLCFVIRETVVYKKRRCSSYHLYLVLVYSFVNDSLRAFKRFIVERTARILVTKKAG